MLMPIATRKSGHESRNRNTRMLFSSSQTPKNTHQPPCHGPCAGRLASLTSPTTMSTNGQKVRSTEGIDHPRPIQQQGDAERHDQESDRQASGIGRAWQVV